MRRISVRLWTPLLAASVVWLFAGCGSGGSDSADTAGEEPVAIAPPPSAPQAQQDSMPGMGVAPGGEEAAVAEAPAEPVEAPVTPSAPGTVSNAAATDEILKMALNENKSLTEGQGTSSSTAPDANASGSGASNSSGGYGAPDTRSSGGESDYAAMMQQQQGGGSSSGGYGAPSTDSGSGGSDYAAMMRQQQGGGSSSGGYGAPSSGNSGGSNSPEMMRNQYGSSSGGGPGPGYPGANQGGAMPGYPGSSNAGGAISGLAAEPDFTNPIKGAESFLAAVATRDGELIAQTVAIRSEFEATPKHKEIFSSILKRSVSQDLIDKMSEAFKDMKVMSTNSVKSTAMLGVIVGRTEESGDTTTWTLEMRREKAGWKLRDFSGPRIFKQNPMFRAQGGRGGATGGGAAGYGSSGGDYSSGGP